MISTDEGRKMENNDYDLNALPEHGIRESIFGTPTRIETLAVGQSDLAVSQWTLIGADKYVPSGRSFHSLPPGFYSVAQLQDGRFFAEKQDVVSDLLKILPGSCNEPVVAGIQEFWRSKELYRRYGLNYKRGVLFYGPPGAGKTATVTLLCKELIEHHAGVVFTCKNTSWLTMVLHNLRRIEPRRPIIVVMEDIDEIISEFGEHDILALLDGEAQIDNVIFLATTNYPDRLGARIVNRPSRFDERIFVDMPSEVTRWAYLEVVTESDPISDRDMQKWVADTKGLSISHLRELVVAVRCLGRSYEDTISRLKSMAVRPKYKEGMGTPLGLAV